MTHRKTFRRQLFFLHRYLGIASALFVTLLAVTGLMLNHTEQLHLDERKVQWAPLLSWYGIEVPKPGNSVVVNGQRLTDFAGQLYLNEQPVTQSTGKLIGAIAMPQFFVAAYESELLLVTPYGELVERLNGLAGVPTPVLAIGVQTKKHLPVLRSGVGEFIADQELFEWRTLDRVENISWSQSQMVPPDVEQRLRALYSGEGLNLESVILDLHSGRIMGSLGVLVMDLAAMTLLLLVGIGVWLWIRR